jgi:uncharacterized membrane protein
MTMLPYFHDSPRLLESLLSISALTVGAVAAMILMLGVVRGLLVFVRGEIRSRDGRNARLGEVRGSVGQYLLLGLELLVAADVMDTILTPSLDHIAVLAGVVLIRTVIGFSLNWELARHDAARQAAAVPAAASGPSAAPLSAMERPAA